MKNSVLRLWTCIYIFYISVTFRSWPLRKCRQENDQRRLAQQKERDKGEAILIILTAAATNISLTWIIRLVSCRGIVFAPRKNPKNQRWGLHPLLFQFFKKIEAKNCWSLVKFPLSWINLNKLFFFLQYNKNIKSVPEISEPEKPKAQFYNNNLRLDPCEKIPKNNSEY